MPLTAPNMRARNLQSRAAQHGFTLLEVLIALVIFSIGLMGIAGLQVSGMRFTHDSQLRTLALAQAETLADRMRSDAAGVQNGFYNIQGPMPSPADVGYVDCYIVTCTSQQLAKFTLATWNGPSGDLTRVEESNHDVLPSGDGVVCIDSTPDDATSIAWNCDNAQVEKARGIYTIKVRWRERLASGPNGPANDVGGNGGADADSDVKIIVTRVVP